MESSLTIERLSLRWTGCSETDGRAFRDTCRDRSDVEPAPRTPAAPAVRRRRRADVPDPFRRGRPAADRLLVWAAVALPARRRHLAAARRPGAAAGAGGRDGARGGGAAAG